MSNIIEFSIANELVGIKEIEPIPAKLNIPEWYKKMKTYHDENAKLFSQTIKACIPVLDSITAGYLLPLPQDIVIEHNLVHQETGEKIQNVVYSNKLPFQFNTNINNDSDPQLHPPNQVGGKDSFWAKKNDNYNINKILNPWRITTPLGYSCLFIPPMHREMDYFHIIPGVVDTDNFDSKINFPFVINHDKYKTIQKHIPQGTPYVQVIPFKRENWKMKVSEESTKGVISRLRWGLKYLNVYKQKIWSKKKWN